MSEQLLIFIFLFLFGGVFAGIGIFGVIRNKKLRQTCMAQTAGVVSEVHCEINRSTDTDSDGTKTRTTTRSYYPEFTYSVGELEYIKRSQIGTNRPRFKKGENVTVMYNSDKPDDYYVVEDKTNVRANIVFAVVGILIIIGAFILPFVY